MRKSCAINSLPFIARTGSIPPPPPCTSFSSRHLRADFPRCALCAPQVPSDGFRDWRDALCGSARVHVDREIGVNATALDRPHRRPRSILKPFQGYLVEEGVLLLVLVRYIYLNSVRSRPAVRLSATSAQHPQPNALTEAGMGRRPACQRRACPAGSIPRGVGAIGGLVPRVAAGVGALARRQEVVHAG